MSRNNLGLLLILAALALPWVGPLANPGGQPDVTPASPVPPGVAASLKEGFSGRKSEASIWSGLLYGLARTIEADSTHPEGPRLKTMYDIAELRDWVTKCPPKPIGGGDVIGQALGPEMAKLGVANEELDQNGRRASLVKLLDGSASTLEDLSR